MKSKVMNLLGALFLIAGVYAAAGGPACKDNYTTCTENGCGVMIAAVNCQLTCSYLGSLFDIECKTPGELKEDSEPSNQATPDRAGPRQLV